jgi:hypothetical protein
MNQLLLYLLTQYAKILPLANIHVMGNAFTNMSLGKVAVSFTHTIKAMIPSSLLYSRRCSLGRNLVSGSFT